MISLKDICYSYDDGPGILGLSLDIPRGDSLALLGPNGSGKSTILRILTGLAHPTTGSYRFDGRDITPQGLKDGVFAKAFHQRVGFLFQNSDAQLFCSSVYDEIAFGPRQMGLSDGVVDARTQDLLGLFGLRDLAARVPYHLSGGEKRKVALASVLSLNPEVLVLDEPMNGLDPKTKLFLRDLLLELRGAGKTIICATHDFAYVQGLFARAAVLSGRHSLERLGPYEEVLGDLEFLKALNIV